MLHDRLDGQCLRRPGDGGKQHGRQHGSDIVYAALRERHHLAAAGVKGELARFALKRYPPV